MNYHSTPPHTVTNSQTLFWGQLSVKDMETLTPHHHRLGPQEGWAAGQGRVWVPWWLHLCSQSALLFLATSYLF